MSTAHCGISIHEKARILAAQCRKPVEWAYRELQRRSSHKQAAKRRAKFGHIRRQPGDRGQAWANVQTPAIPANYRLPYADSED